jgi:hypothetical protein
MISVRREDSASVVNKPRMVTCALCVPGRIIAAQRRSAIRGMRPEYMIDHNTVTLSTSANGYRRAILSK